MQDGYVKIDLSSASPVSGNESRKGSSEGSPGNSRVEKIPRDAREMIARGAREVVKRYTEITGLSDITQSFAEGLVRRYGREKLDEKLGLLEKRLKEARVDIPLAFLVKALREDWPEARHRAEKGEQKPKTYCLKCEGRGWIETSKYNTVALCSCSSPF